MKFKFFPSWGQASSEAQRGCDDSDGNSSMMRPDGLQSAIGSIMSISTRVTTFEEVIMMNGSSPIISGSMCMAKLTKSTCARSTGWGGLVLNDKIYSNKQSLKYQI